MAHGITETDGLVLTKERAWHGLGTVVQEAPTPREAMELAGMNWQVSFTNGVGGTTEDGPVYTHTHKLVVRDDNHEVLGCVSKDYQAIQNDTLAEFAEALQDSNDLVQVESAGTLFGGRRLFYLLKGETFETISSNDASDPVIPYILLSNSHDGSLSFSARPTSIRVVCNNTLEWALGNKSRNIFRLKHTKNLLASVEDARKALNLYSKGIPVFKDNCEMLNKQKMDSLQLVQYFENAYDILQAGVASKDSESAFPEAVKKGHFVEDCEYVLHEEMDLHKYRPTLWTSFNAVSRKIQESSNTHHATERQVANRLFGAANEKTNKIWKATLAQASSN